MIKLGVIANEFLDASIGRMGGFGWAARQLGNVFGPDGPSGVEVVFLSGEHFASDERDVIESQGTRLLLRRGRRHWYRSFQAARKEKIDVLLSIDYRPSYDFWFWTLPRTPVIVWARDPRTQADVDRINTLRLPGQDDVMPEGVGKIDCTGLARVVKRSSYIKRPVVVAHKMPHLAKKTTETYGFAGQSFVLPNPDVVDYTAARRPKSEHPSVVYLGRLDPIKRPWLFMELARAFPGVEFIALGQAHFDGESGWQPENVPSNVRLMGHVGGPEKLDILASAWVLVNTSIYEEAPVSVFEALAYETPVLSCTDWGDVASRFGVYVGEHNRTGLDALPELRSGLNRLITNNEWRQELGRTGRAYVEQTHSNEAFLSSFASLCRHLGVKSPIFRRSLTMTVVEERAHTLA
jgi:glycosyltransferase involved in cell wall biosynthesis